VFGVGFCEGTNKEGAPVGLLPHTYSLRPPEQIGVLPSGAQGRIEDERDIAFVLVSRAKEEVHLSGVREYRGSAMHPSRFVVEMELV
jgi:superfamily I DNA/RNA helicase